MNESTSQGQVRRRAVPIASLARAAAFALRLRSKELDRFPHSVFQAHPGLPTEDPLGQRIVDRGPKLLPGFGRQMYRSKGNSRRLAEQAVERVDVGFDPVPEVTRPDES